MHVSTRNNDIAFSSATYPAVKGVQHGVSSAVSHSAGPVSLSTLAVLEALASEGTLVDSAVGHARERHAIVLQLKRSRTLNDTPWTCILVSVCMGLCVHKCICLYVCIHSRVSVCISASVCVSAFIHVCLCACLYSWGNKKHPYYFSVHTHLDIWNSSLFKTFQGYFYKKFKTVLMT